MNQDIERLFNTAYQLQQNDKLKEAIQSYEQLLKKNPAYSPALHFLGLAYAQLSDMESAILYLKKALEIAPEDAIIHNNLANAYKKQHHFDKAIEHYQQALKVRPDYSQALNNLAAVYAMKGEYKKALHHYRLAVHAAPDFAAAHYNLGLLLMQHQELEAAKKQFLNVLTLNPSHLEAQFYLGILHLEANELEEAESAFRNVLSIDNEHVDSLVNLGVIALKKDKGQVAVDYFTKALAYDNNHIDARNNLAATFIHHDRFENALMHYDVLLKKEPFNIEYLYNSGVAEMALGHLQEACSHFENVLSIEPLHFESLTNMAAIYVRLEEREKAINFLERALTVKPEDSATHFMLKALTGDEKQPPESLEYVNNLFNNYALYYDQHMKNTLKYALPEHIAKVLHQLHVLNIEHTVDLGCGTGLSGVVLREISQHLTGVDIASKMLAQAKDKQVYDVVVEDELVSFLKKTEQFFNLAVAADVLPYFGDLDPLFYALSRRLKPDGLFVFTAEIGEEKRWHLQETARFCHNPEYIQSLCTQYNLTILHQETVTGRLQDQKGLSVMLYVLKLGQHP